METVELLRKLIDILSAKQEPSVVLAPEPQCDFPEDEHTNDETGGIMVPPLQLKMELLKKVAGIGNVYDQGEVEHPQDEPEQPQDELEIIKKNAGIPAIIATVASEDNDILE